MRVSCSDGVRPSGLCVRYAFAQLAFEAGDAHHEKFVKIVGGNRQEAHAFEQWMMLVGRLLQYAPIKVEPRQFAVDESLRS